MSKPLRALSASVVLLLVIVAALVSFSYEVRAASRTWTSDTDFTQSGAGGSAPVFTSTQVVGTGTSAHVDLVQDVLDWANKNPAANPGGREGPGLVFASQAGFFILFGGHNQSCGCDKLGTWKYTYGTNTWSQIATTGAPPGREWPGLSYDSMRNIVVLFGGANSTNGFLRDTWEFDITTSTWAQQAPPTSPPALADSPLVYDVAADRHIVFGQDIANGVMNTWAYNAGAHTWANPNPPAPKPSQRSGFAMAYDASLQRTVLFGGSFFTTLYGDTWEYNYGGNAWSQTSSSGPTARAGHSMVYHAPDTSVYLFGGFVNPGYSAETWKYPTSRAWSSVATNNQPVARQFAGLAVDTTNDIGILFGGSDQFGTFLSDTWRLGASYEAAGKYKSVVFDSGGANAVWGQIWWNKTPASQPANTYLRFQVSTGNILPPDASWTLFSADASCSSVSSYFTTPGTAIPSCNNNHRYLMFLADFGSLDTTVTPSMEDVTITYTVPPASPYIVATDPADSTFQVPSTWVVNVTFSEPMNKTSLAVTILTGPPVAFDTVTWTDADTIVHLAHSTPFTEAKVYRLQVAAKDLDGNALVPNPNDSTVVNPWTFVTLAIHPTITNATPYNGQGYPIPSPPVPVTQNVVIQFSEPMNETAVISINPSLALAPVWSNNDQTLTLTHPPSFATCTKYTVQVNATDKSNLALVPGTVANPWSFYTACPPPYIWRQIPASGQGGVAQNAPIDVDFSEPMNVGTVTFSINPAIAGTFTLSTGPGGANSHLRWTHGTNFALCGVYTITITGKDADEGLDLIANPFDPSIENPWTFVATCNNPFIMWTKPANGDTVVSVNQEFQIFFYPPPPTQMNTASVVYQVTGGPYRETNVSWDAGTLEHIQHLALRECTHYTVQVTQARNANGAGLVPGPAPNPWSFDTECVSPYVTDTNPKNNSVLVPVNQPIFVNFSAPMDTPSVVFVPNPPIGGITYTWLPGDQSLRIDHADMIACQLYQVLVDGLDKTGRSLLTGPATPFAPNPWSFTTKCAGFYIALTDPADGATNVPFPQPINVTFSLAANRAKFQITVSPSVGTLTPSWSGGDTVVSVTHSTPFSDCVQYTVTVSAEDTLGNQLINVTGSKPNPWRFTAHCVPPQILTTDPADGAAGVPLTADIIVTFSEPIITSSVTWSITPSVTLTVRSWTNGNRVLTLMHSVSFTPGIQYCPRILTARDVQNNPLAAGPVPNPWCFTTSSGLPGPTGLRVAGPGPTDVILTWNAVAGAAAYVVYSAQSRLAVWPWPTLATVTSPSYVHAGGWSDGANHFYIVRARDSGGALSTNSTMGVKTQVSFAFSSTRTNVQWLSLPYRTKYHTAKDISDELTNAKIDVVGKWVPSTQSTVQWVYLRGQWRGNNFAINPGDGIYVGIRSTFAWIINGTDGSVPHAFVLYPTPNRNINWFSLPYTSIYTKASDIVLDIEGSLGPGANTKIIELGKWDPTTQTVITFSWTPAGWTGSDFLLAPGDGMYLRINSSFTWTPRLITPEVP